MRPGTRRKPAMKRVVATAGLALALAGCGHPQQPSATTSARLCSVNNLPCQRPGTEPRFYSGDELRYLGQLDSEHVPYIDAPQAVDTGHMVCPLEPTNTEGDFNKAVPQAVAR